MTLRLTMIDQLAPTFKDLAEQWQGPLLVTDLRDGKTWHTGPGDLVDLGETKVLVQWEGPDPTGVILPLDCVQIEQVAHHGKDGRR